jgi:hypothetical protein
MELIKAAKQGITCLRKPYWDPEVYLELGVDEEGINAFAGLVYPLPEEEQGLFHSRIIPVILTELSFNPDNLGMTGLADAYKGDDWEEYKEESKNPK